MTGQDARPPDRHAPPAASLGALRRHREEVRAVVDHQVETLNEFDDAALRTSRIAAVVLALVLSAARLSGSSPLLNGFVRAGCGGLLCTFVLGLLTHGASSVNLGPSPERVSDLRSRPYSEREWLLSLLEEYTEWIDANRRVLYRNGLYLKVTQVVLLSSVLLLGVGIVTTTVESPLLA